MSGRPIVRAARARELPAILGLIDDTFRRGFHPSMGVEFAHMLCEDNLDNVRVISAEGNPVSVLGIYRSRLHIEGSLIEAASIGAVCTHPDYRKRGFASALMDDALGKLKKERADILLISGRQPIYLERGCTVVGNFYECVLDAGAATGAEREMPELRGHESEAAALWAREPVRFLRSRTDFQALYRNATLDHQAFTFHSHLLKSAGRPVAYLILRIKEGPQRTGTVIEYAGERSVIADALPGLVARYALARLALHVPAWDPLLSRLQEAGASTTPTMQEGCVRILRFSALMEGLHVYLSQRVPGEVLDRIEVTERGDTRAIRAGKDCYETTDLSALTRAIFDGVSGVPEAERIPTTSPLGAFLRTAFPLPFPSARSLNYI
jgi:predicted acetyltransferase